MASTGAGMTGDEAHGSKAVGGRLKNTVEGDELGRDVTTEESSVVQNEGERNVR